MTDEMKHTLNFLIDSHGAHPMLHCPYERPGQKRPCFSEALGAEMCLYADWVENAGLDVLAHAMEIEVEVDCWFIHEGETFCVGDNS